MTFQKKIILEEIKKLVTHPTADEIYTIVRLRIPHISLGTIYRNLDLLHRAGTIEKLELAGFQSRYDGNPAHHHHLHCLKCNRMDDVSAEGIEIPTRELEVKSEYRVTGYRLEFSGICPECQKSGEAERSQI